MLCLLAGFSVLGALIVRHSPMTIEAPGVPPSPSFMFGVVAFSVLLYLVLAIWAIVTVVGLFRMRNWARISIMVIGGGIALIGLFSTLVSAAMPTMMKSVPMPPNTTPALMRGTFIFMAIVWLAVASIGIWWLVYFALRRTRESFAHAALQQGLPASSIGMTAYPLASSPMTDFTVARPMVYEPPPPPAETYLPPPQLQPAVPKRPVSITIIAVLMFLGAATTLLMTLLPIPAFFFGVVLPGWTGRVLYLVFACVSGFAGIGLLRLQKPAWVLSFAFYGLGLLNVLSMALPGVRQRLLDYQQNLSHTMGMRVTAPVFGAKLMNFFLLCSMVFDVFLFVFLMVLLWRARWAFETRVNA